jgi:CRP-like cAMP-binding protein
LLDPHLRELPLIQGSVLQEQEAPVEQVYFPLAGVISLMSVLEAGDKVETAMVGREGAVGAFAGFGPWNALTRAVVRIPGVAAVISTSCFRSAVAESDRIGNLILRYKEGLLAQVQQTAACNALHSIEARLARWLLQASDRIDDRHLPLTQDGLAQMLAVRRTTVTLIAGKLQQQNLITYRRGHIVILNRDGVERLACECYGAIRRRTDAAVPVPAARVCDFRANGLGVA